MLCPKCGDIELEPVTMDKLEYLACINGCEGVWVGRKDLQKYWGKKKFKTLEDELEEVKQPAFEQDVDADKEHHVNGKKAEPEKGAFKEEVSELDEIFEEDADEDDEDDIYADEDEEEEVFDDEDEEEEEEEEEEDDYSDEDEEDEEEEEDDEEIEEINFNKERRLNKNLLNEDGEYEEQISETGEGFTTTSELIEEDDDDGIQIEEEEEETFFLTSPVSGNPMKKYIASVKEKVKCNIASCPDSDSYWIDGSDEILSLIMDKITTPKTFADLLAYERPEEEIFEEEDEDEDEDI